MAVHLEWILVPLFSSLTGYTEGAIYKKIHDGVWIEGKHYIKAPDNRVTLNLQEYYRWVEGQPVVV